MHLAYIQMVSHLSAKNYQNWCKFDEVLTKTNLLSFFLGHGVQIVCNNITAFLHTRLFLTVTVFTCHLCVFLTYIQQFTNLFLPFHFVTAYEIRQLFVVIILLCVFVAVLVVQCAHSHKRLRGLHFCVTCYVFLLA